MFWRRSRGEEAFMRASLQGRWLRRSRPSASWRRRRLRRAAFITAAAGAAGAAAVAAGTAAVAAGAAAVGAAAGAAAVGAAAGVAAAGAAAGVAPAGAAVGVALVGRRLGRRLGAGLGLCRLGLSRLGLGHPGWGWGAAAAPVVVGDVYADPNARRHGCWVYRRAWSQPNRHGRYLGRVSVNVCQ